MPRSAYDEPSKVDALDGEVTLDGPDGVAVAVTPRAARLTAVRLEQQADKADDQNDLKAHFGPPRSRPRKP